MSFKEKTFIFILLCIAGFIWLRPKMGVFAMKKFDFFLGIIIFVIFSGYGINYIRYFKGKQVVLPNLHHSFCNEPEVLGDFYVFKLGGTDVWLNSEGKEGVLFVPVMNCLKGIRNIISPNFARLYEIEELAPEQRSFILRNNLKPPFYCAYIPYAKLNLKNMEFENIIKSLYAQMTNLGNLLKGRINYDESLVSAGARLATIFGKTQTTWEKFKDIITFDKKNE